MEVNQFLLSDSTSLEAQVSVSLLTEELLTLIVEQLEIPYHLTCLLPSLETVSYSWLCRLVDDPGIANWKKQSLVDTFQDQDFYDYLFHHLPPRNSLLLNLICLTDRVATLQNFLLNPSLPTIYLQTALQYYLRLVGNEQELLILILPKLENQNLIKNIVNTVTDTNLMRQQALLDSYPTETMILIARRLQDEELYLHLLRNSDLARKNNLMFTIKSKEVFLKVIAENISLPISTIAYFRIQRLGFDQDTATQIALTTEFEPLLIGAIDGITSRKHLAKLRLALPSHWQPYVTNRIHKLSSD